MLNLARNTHSIAQLPRATFYYHLKRMKQVDKYESEKQEITAIYHENKGRYGYRRITAELHKRNFRLNHKTVQRLMKELGLYKKGRDDQLSSNKLTDAEARQLLEMTKKSLVQEINFPTRGNEKEFDVVGDTKKDIFDQKEIFYSDNVQFTGISGFAHNYDFLLQRTKAKPERLCQAVNNPNKSSIGNILFAWNDTKPSRKNGSQLVVILSDQNTVAKGVEDAFANYDVKVIRWSQREKEENIALVSA